MIAGALEELPRSLELAVLGLLIPYVKGSLTKGSLWWIGAFTAVELIIQVTVVGVLGDFGAMELFPYYTVLTTVQVSVLQRLDIVATAIWIGALFLKIAFFGMLFIDCFQRVTGQKWRMLIAAAGSVVAPGGGSAPRRRRADPERAALHLVRLRRAAGRVRGGDPGGAGPVGSLAA